MRMDRSISAIVLAVFVTQAFAQNADEFMPKFKTEIKEEGELKLDWTWQPYIAGNLFFMSVHRNGSIVSFRRDEQSGDIKFLSSVDVAKDLGNPGRHNDPNFVMSNKNIVYVAGGWTHAHGDHDSLGLSWYQVEPKDGTFKKLGNIPCAAGTPLASANPNLLYFTTYFAGEIHQIKLDPNDGKPIIAEKVKGKGLGNGLVGSPDGKFYYSSNGASIGVMTSASDGLLSYSGSVEVPDVANVSRNCLFTAPDGKHIYLQITADKKSYVAIFNRDAKSGILSFAEKFEMGEFDGVAQVTFLSDGKIGYWCGGPETPASGFGYVKRDPVSGKLTCGGKAPGGTCTWRFAYAADTGTIYLAGYWSSKGFKIFTAQRDPGAVAVSLKK